MQDRDELEIYLAEWNQQNLNAIAELKDEIRQLTEAVQAKQKREQKVLGR